jgi:hypothetical protein
LSGVRFVQASEGHPGLPVGSWSVEVLPDPGSPVPPGLNVAAFTADGILINSNMTGATLDGPFVTDLYTAEGAHIASVTGTVHCERLAVQPMP